MDAFVNLRPLKGSKATDGNSVKLWPAILLALFLVACSDSNTISDINEAPLILPAKQIFMHEGIVWEYQADKKITQQLLDLNEVLYAVHDTDEIEEDRDFFSNTVQKHNPLANFVSYSDSESLKLFDLETRYTHDLYDFSSIKNPNGPELVCDIQASTVFDKESFTADGFVMKEELVIHVSAVDYNAGNCDVTDDLRFYQIKLVEAQSKYSVRQQVVDLKRQVLPEGFPPLSDLEPTTGRPLCDPDLKILESDDTADEDRIEFCVTSKIEKRDFPILKGEKSLGYDALMYASAPIKDPNNSNQYGYLGYDRQREELVFFLRSGEELTLSKLWSMPLTDYALQADYHVRFAVQASVFGDEYRRPKNQIIGSNLLIEIGDSLHYLPLRSLFDDDLNSLRITSLNAPLHQRIVFDADSYSPLSIQIDSSGTYASFLDGSTLVTVHSVGPTIPSTETQALTTTGTEAIDTLAVGTTNLIKKIYADGEIQNASWVFYSGAVENTALPRTISEFQSFTVESDAKAYLNVSENNDAAWSSIIFSTTQTKFTANNSLLLNSVDSRSYAGHESGPTYAPLALSSVTPLGSYPPSLATPSLYTISNDLVAGPNQNPADTLLAENIPAEIRASEANKVYILNDDYGLIRAMTSGPNGNELKFFYFDPSDEFDGIVETSIVEEIPICEFELSCSL